MEFKKGDIVYCVDSSGDNSSLITNIKYTVIDVSIHGAVSISTFDIFYRPSRFVSELEYRRLKLIKLKDGIQKRRHSLLY